MVCPCCEPCRALCPGLAFPDAIVFTISEAVFEDGGGYWFDEDDLTFALTDSFVLTRGSGFCLGWGSAFFTQPGNVFCNPPGAGVAPTKLGISVLLGANSSRTAFTNQLDVQVSVRDTEASLKRRACVASPSGGIPFPEPVDESCAVQAILANITGINSCDVATQGYSGTIVNPNAALCNPLRSISFSFGPA